MPLLSLIEDNLNFVLDLNIPACSLSVGNTKAEEKKVEYLTGLDNPNQGKSPLKRQTTNKSPSLYVPIGGKKDDDALSPPPLGSGRDGLKDMKNILKGAMGKKESRENQRRMKELILESQKSKERGKN